MQSSARFFRWGLFLALSTLCTLAPLPCAALGDFWQPLTGPYGGNVKDLLRQPDGDFFLTLAALGTGNLGVLRSRLPAGSIASDTGRQPTLTAWLPGANPTHGVTAFALELTRDARVSLALYDVRGRVVSKLWSGATLGAGRYMASWRPDLQVASGTHFYRLDVGGALRSGRVTLVR